MTKRPNSYAATLVRTLVALAPVTLAIATASVGQDRPATSNSPPNHDSDSMRSRARMIAQSAAFKALPVNDPVTRWRTYIAEASRRFGVPQDWIIRVIRAESGGHTVLAGRPIISRKGAMGLMQLMPATWAAIRAEQALGSDPFDPRDNILAGTAYLAKMYRRFGYPGLFAAYNAGPGRYAGWRAGRQSLPRETRKYLALVGGRGADDVRAAPDLVAANPVSPPALFVVQHDPTKAVVRSSPASPAPPSLFVPLSASDTRDQSD